VKLWSIIFHPDVRQDLGVKEEERNVNVTRWCSLWVKWSKNALTYLLMVHVESKVRVASQGCTVYPTTPYLSIYRPAVLLLIDDPTTGTHILQELFK
jgi:hypothetical protein